MHLWVAEEGFQYEIWTDTNRELALHYGATSSSSSNFASRVTRLLDEDGNLLLEYNNVDFGTNPRLVLDDCNYCLEIDSVQEILVQQVARHKNSCHRCSYYKDGGRKKFIPKLT